MKQLSLDQVINLFEQARSAGKVAEFEKFGQTWARPARAGEIITTVIAGKPETRNTANDGDIVVTGPADEEYIIGPEKFAARYKLLGEVADERGRKLYSPIGKIHAFTYDGDPISFTAPWGEQMIAEPGDAIGTTEIGSRDVYRVERTVFAQTYRRPSPAAA